VSENPSAIGVISLSWFSDRDDPKSKEILSKVRPVGIVDPSNTDRPTLARRPYQAYVFDQSYPLRRDVYYIRTGLKGSLGTGFASHLAGEKGQLIIHKMGMVAATSPVRQVKIVD
jgi:phosphate transport system substrate-binding protein